MSHFFDWIFFRTIFFSLQMKNDLRKETNESQKISTWKSPLLSSSKIEIVSIYSCFLCSFYKKSILSMSKIVKRIPTTVRSLEFQFTFIFLFLSMLPHTIVSFRFRGIWQTWKCRWYSTLLFSHYSEMETCQKWKFTLNSFVNFFRFQIFLVELFFTERDRLLLSYKFKIKAKYRKLSTWMLDYYYYWLFWFFLLFRAVM